MRSISPKATAPYGAMALQTSVALDQERWSGKWWIHAPGNRGAEPPGNR